MDTTNVTKVARDAGKLFLPKTADAVFKVDGVVAFIAKANTSANAAVETTQEQIKGGQTNSVIGVVTSEKAVTASFTTPEWQPEFLAANVGSKIRYGKQNFFITNQTFTVDENGKITLTDSPSDGVIQIETSGGYISVQVGESKEVDVTAYGFAAKNCVTVLGFFPKEGKEISIETDTDPFVGELTLSSPIFKGTKGRVGEAQYVFPAFALSGNWNQTFEANAAYEISGTAIATEGEKCGESGTYGYYREFIENDETLNNFVNITATPSVAELQTGETQQITVYGIRGALSEKSDITEDATFAVVGEGTTVTISDKGLIAAGSEAVETPVEISVTVGDKKTTVKVTVAAKV